MDIRTYLKNLPSGTTLYSVVSGEVEFKEIRNDAIVVLNRNHCEELYHWSGHLWNSGMAGECVLFPSKELRDWELFTKFKKGDIVVKAGLIVIFDHLKDEGTIVFNAILRTNGTIVVKTDVGIGNARDARLATQEEKDLFFDSLSKAGYSWNGEEVIPVFKKGDIIISSGGGCVAVVDHVGRFGSFNDVVYYQCCLDHHGELTVKTDVGIGHASDCKYACIHDQERILRKLNEHGYVLDGDTVVKKKFNPQTFEPFQKVLVRATSTSNWRCTFFSHMSDNKAICSGDNWSCCIPYENNEYLRGKANDCDEFYKWWENK